MDNELMTRLDAVERRLLAHSQAITPDGLTEPDDGGTERWEAGQVWAHIGEFVPYWHGQLRAVVGNYSGTPVPFGRMRTDPVRVGTIEENRNEPIAEHMAATNASLSGLRSYVATLTLRDWAAVGQHPVRGPISADKILETFVVDHLEEHADQLDGLR